MNDSFSDGTQSIVNVLRPKGSGWQEIDRKIPNLMGYPMKTFFHAESLLAVLSAVEVTDEKPSKGPEYHISISKQTVPMSRCTSNEAKWVCEQFGLEGAEEDNHVPAGMVRNFWRPVADRLVGLECECKESEPVIREDKGDFEWRPAPEKSEHGT